MGLRFWRRSQEEVQAGLGMVQALRGLRARGYVPDVVYDVGASDGSWTRMALDVWPRARFACFEPLEERRGALADLAAAHPRQISVVPVGVGDEDTTLSLGITDALWDSSFAYAGASARSVPVRRLDTLLGQGAIDPPDLVKLDVQGFERRALAGGLRAVAHAQVVLMECSFFPFCAEMVTLDQSIAFMADRGFVPYEFVDYLRRPLDGAMGQCDLLFVRRGHALLADARWSKG